MIRFDELTVNHLFAWQPEQQPVARKVMATSRRTMACPVCGDGLFYNAEWLDIRLPIHVCASQLVLDKSPDLQ